MAEALKRRDAKIFRLIESMLRIEGIAPTFAEMRAHGGFHSNSPVTSSLARLEAGDLIRRLDTRARAIEVLKLPAQLTVYEQTLVLVKASTIPAPSRMRSIALAGLKHVQPDAHTPRAGLSSDSAASGMRLAVGGLHRSEVGDADR